MQVNNCEFKARTTDLDRKEEKLLSLGAAFAGLDHQRDTYFRVPHGRLKLREGNIEHALIHYDRANIAGIKESRVILYRHAPDPALKEILIRQFGVLTVVNKHRKIYYLENTKIHFDEVDLLGTFLEVEVMDTGSSRREDLQERCDYFAGFFEIGKEDFIDASYSDMTIACMKGAEKPF